jgi:hypothetical protein
MKKPGYGLPAAIVSVVGIYGGYKLNQYRQERPRRVEEEMLTLSPQETIPEDTEALIKHKLL